MEQPNVNDQPAKLVVPEYAGPHPLLRRSHVNVRAAMVCGLIPLATGCAIFAAWIPTRRLDLAFAGLLNIAVGLVFVAVGAILLAVHFQSISGPRRVARFLSTCWLALIFLLINFPAAWGIIHAVDYIERAYPRGPAGGSVLD